MCTLLYIFYISIKAFTKKKKNTNREKERLNLDESRENLFKQDRLNRIRCEKVGTFARYLCSFFIVSLFESRCEVKVRGGGFRRSYEIGVLREQMAQGYVVRFVDIAQGPFELCPHKINVKLISIGGMFHCSHIQLSKGMEQTENWMWEDQSFTRRARWKESEPREVRAHEWKWMLYLKPKPGIDVSKWRGNWYWQSDS